MHEIQRSPYPSPARSPWRSSKYPRNKNLRMGRRSIWTRAKHRVGLERPHFCTRLRGQSESRVAPARQETSVRCARGRFRRSRCRRQELPTATSSLPPSSRWNVRKCRESEEINDTRMRRVTQKKTPDWAGATPLFGSQSAQKFCPGRSRPLLHSGAHVCSPRAKRPRSWPSNPQVPVKRASPPSSPQPHLLLHSRSSTALRKSIR